MSKQVLAWTRRVEAQGDQTTMLDNIKQNKEFDAVKSYKPTVKPIQHKVQESRIIHHQSNRPKIQILQFNNKASVT